MKKTILLFAGLLACSFQPLLAQTESGTASHWYNRANFNPASIARPGFIYFFSNCRKQWTGIDGAPSVYNLNVSGYSDEKQSAVGLSLLRDDIGVTTALNPMLQYAYRIKLGRELDLSLGLALGYYFRTIKGSEYEAVEVDDPAIDYTTQRYSAPDAQLGFEIEGQYFIAGASTTHLVSLWKDDEEYLVSNHRYVYALYKNSEHESYNLSVGMQVSNRANLTVIEGTGIVRFKRPTGLQKGPTELFDLGLSYRSNNQLTLICGLNLSPNIRLGYTYDFNTGAELNVAASHEIVLEYRIPLRRYRNTHLLWYY